MLKVALLLVCLACTGHGRKIPKPTSPVARKHLQADASEIESEPVNALASFLLAYNPAVTLNPSRSASSSSLTGTAPSTHRTVPSDVQHDLQRRASVMKMQASAQVPSSSTSDMQTATGKEPPSRTSALSPLARYLRSAFSRPVRRVQRVRNAFSRPGRKIALFAATLAAVAAKAPAAHAIVGIMKELVEARHHVSATESNTMVLLLTSAFVTPMMRALQLSPVLGFLFAGMIIGPSGLALVSDVSRISHLAELGVVFFLFEMGLELELDLLKSVGKDAFRLGTSQVILTSLVIGSLIKFLGLSTAAAIVLGGCLALSSSAVVIQLLKESDELGSRFGRAAFATLLFQDLAVVPLIVVTPLLSSTGAALRAALGAAASKLVFALCVAYFTGRRLLNPIFKLVASAKDQTSFLAVTLFTVVSMSTFTSSLGLSDTLGAFLAGEALAGTKFRYQIEADIAPFRGILLGLFFITTGFSIDLPSAIKQAPLILGLTLGLHTIKTIVFGLICRAGGLRKKAALRAGLILSQGGEFAFVVLQLAQRHGILAASQVKLLLNLVVTSMFLTPFLNTFGKKVISYLEARKGSSPLVPETPTQDDDLPDQGDYVVLAGYGTTAKLVGKMLSTKLIRYKAFDQDPQVVAEARDAGRPVFVGDASRPDVLEAFMKEDKNQLSGIVVTIDDERASLKAVRAFRKMYPDVEAVPIFARAITESHRTKLGVSGAIALSTGQEEASLLLGGAALSRMGVSDDEVVQLIEEERKQMEVNWLSSISSLSEELLGGNKTRMVQKKDKGFVYMHNETLGEPAKDAKTTTEEEKS